MLTLTSEFFFGVFIGFVLGLLLNGIIYNNQLHNMGLLTQDHKVQKVVKNETIGEQNLFARYRNVVERFETIIR